MYSDVPAACLGGPEADDAPAHVERLDGERQDAIVGAVIGGYLFQTFGMAGVTGVNLYSILVAVVGAIVFLVIYHALFRRRARV